MKGLMIKDLKNFLVQGKIILAILFFYFIYSIIYKNYSMVLFVMIMMGILIPSTLSAMDEKSSWDRYAVALPVARRNIVISRYLIFTISTLLLFGICLAGNFIFEKTFTYDTFRPYLFGIAACFIIQAIQTPLLFKFGAEKARFAVFGVCFIPALLIGVIGDGITSVMIEKVLSMANIFPLIGFVMLGLSMLFSIQIYERKEF